MSPIFYITIGSGIGGGLIINGEIYRGCGRGAAEIGHLHIISPYLKTAGELERLASGWAIGHAPEMYWRYGWAGGAQPFWKTAYAVERMTAQDVAAAAADGELLACCVLADAWEALALGISHVIALLCPQRIIIGGGVSLMGEKLLFEPLRGMVAQRIFKPFANCYDIVPAALGEEVVVHGALALAHKRLGGTAS